MSVRHRRRLPFGAELVAPDRTRFRLWAPSLAHVSVAIEGRDDLPMQADGDGWFEIEAACGAGTRYRYRVAPPDGGDAMLVPDPASRAQADDVNGPSVVIDPTAFDWRHGDWPGRAWAETVIYEIHPGLAGGFAGIERLLPEIASLGITAIELMPISDFPGPRNWGYDGVLPFAPDATYGTPDQLKSLIDSAHGLGVMVFLDVVYNHFGPDGNYLGVYADPFFRDDIKTPWGRAIDFRRREVRDFFCNNALYWIDEFRFDGLRLDATHSIVPQDWLGELAACVTAAVDRRHVHLVIEHEGNAAHLIGPHHGFDAQWNDDCHHVLHVLLTDEDDGYYVDFATDAADKLARCMSEGFIYQGEPSPFREGQPRGEPSKDLPPTAFVSFMQNHDQIGNRAFGERLTSLADPLALEAAFAMLMLSPQIPLIFMGEERASTTPFLFFTSFHDELADLVREGRRNEFGSARGFADPAVRHTIPDPNDATTFERSRVHHASPPPDDDTALAALARTRRLLALRRAHIIPRLEGARSLGAEAVGPKAIVARWHLGDGAVLTLAVNLGMDAVDVPGHRFHLRGDLIYSSPDPVSTPAHDRAQSCLPGRTTWALIESATTMHRSSELPT